MKHKIDWQKYSFFLLIGSIVVILTTFSAFKHPQSKTRVIVIDAGHGGHDHGCMYGGANEKDITLSVSLLFGKMLQDSFPDYKIIYTRSSDSFVELHERASIANRNSADLFISIHVNASPSVSAYGTETYAMGLHKSQGNLSVAKRENSSVLMEKDYQQNYDGFDPNSPEGHIIFSLYQNQFLSQSLSLASLIENQFKASNRYSRGVKQAGFLVLWKTTMPSILIETGYLSNSIERKYLVSSEGQFKTAQSVYEAFKSYTKYSWREN
ncbi:MAG: N-acetylmuramoyl-L-alanine amidase [Bacteroidetes bacterium]|nr:N-acetylmuramoyl-L-alanine amidase [Bacteroidota bacterium]